MASPARKVATGRTAAGSMPMAELLRVLEDDSLGRRESPSQIHRLRRAGKRLVAIEKRTAGDVSDMTADHLPRFLADQPRPHELHGALWLFVRRSDELGLLPSLPKIPKPPQWGHREESPAFAPVPTEPIVQRLLKRQCEAAAKEDGWGDFRGYVLTATATLTGLLVGDLRVLLVEDVDLDAGTITIRRRAGRRFHVNRIHPALKAILASWIPHTGCAWLFPGNKLAGAWTHTQAHAWLRESARLAKAESAGTFTALRRFFHTNSVPDIPGLSMGVPPRLPSIPPSRGAAALPVRPLTEDELTRFMVELRRDSATWDGDRVFTLYALALFEGLHTEELGDLARADVDLVRASPVLSIPGRDIPLVLRTEDGAGILRRWSNRPDQIDSDYVFPNHDGGRWVIRHGVPSHARIRRAALRAGVTARVLPSDLLRYRERCGGKIELGAAWLDGRQPDPIATGPDPKLRGAPRKSLGRQGSERKPATRPDVATWAPAAIPAVKIKGREVLVRGESIGTVPDTSHATLELLLKRYPDRVSKEELDEECGVGWRRSLERLCVEHSILRSAISFPGKDRTITGYAIVDV